VTNEDREKFIRVNVLDTLVSQSGKQLTPDVIGQLTSEIMSRLNEILSNCEEYK
jgi:hypothetical protein